ncbi:MAG TPA: hypothetical protein DCL40_05805 [Coxiellaceae bacterium]|nr:hypothetical protein [Coxiellaceae bacterium]
MNITTSATLSLFKGMPSRFWTITWISCLMTMGYSSIYVTLILYVKHDFSFSNQDAITLLGQFFSYNFTINLLTSYVAEKWVSCRQLLAVAISSSTLGFITLSIKSLFCLHLGLSLIVSGLGMGFTCAYLLRSQTFIQKPGSIQLAFIICTIAYNLAHLVIYVIAGWMQLTHHYQWIFITDSVLSCGALILLIKHWGKLGDYRGKFSQNSAKHLSLSTKAVAVTIIGFNLILFYLLTESNLTSALIIGLTIIMALQMITRLLSLQGVARHQMRLFLILLSIYLFLCTLDLLGPMILTIFEINNVNRTVFNITIPIGWIEGLRTLIYFCSAPILIMLYQYIHKRFTSNKLLILFSFSALSITFSMVMLLIGIEHCNQNGYTSISWLLVYMIFYNSVFFYSTPLSFSMINELTPQNMHATLTGAVTFSYSIASVLAVYISNHILHNATTSNPLSSNAFYSHNFAACAWLALCIGLIPLILIKRSQKYRIRSA